MKMIEWHLVRSKSSFLNHIIALNALCVKKTPTQPPQKMMSDFVLERKALTNTTYSGILAIFFSI